MFLLVSGLTDVVEKCQLDGFLKNMYFYVPVCFHMPWHVGGGPRITCGGSFSPDVPVTWSCGFQGSNSGYQA